MSDKQQQAIHDYLEALLQDVGEALPEKPQFQEEEQPKTIGLEELVAQIPEVITEAPVETVTETETVVEVKEQPVVEDIVVTETVEEAVVETSFEQEQLVPDWAQEPFQCLLFKVSGLSLAVPLVKLNSVIPWTKKIVETPNQTDWYLGLVHHLDTNVKVIDTALMVLPENRQANIAADPSDRFSHILLVDNSRWGLACDTIGDVIWLKSDQVKWRADKTKRPWLAGTALEHLCALMDTEVFADMLNEKTAV